VTTISLSGTAGQNGWFTSSVMVTLTATDDLSGVASTVYSVDGGAWQAYSAPFTLTADGNHTVQYHSTDRAGNVEANHSVTVKVDTSLPLLTNLSPSGHLTTSSVKVTWQGSDAISGIADYAVSVDGGAFQDLGMSNFTTLMLSDGTHTLTVRATSGAGQTSTQSTTVSVDTNTFSFTGPYSGLPTIALLLVAVDMAPQEAPCSNVAATAHAAESLRLGTSLSLADTVMVPQ
jgi:hypothetical protein